MSPKSNGLSLFREALLTGMEKRAKKKDCDQVHPTCGACQRHDVFCEYGENYIHLHSTGSSTRREPIKQRAKQQQLNSTRSDASRNALRDQGLGARPPAQLFPVSRSENRLLELRLLHYYTVFTSQTWAPPQARYTYSHITPSLAMSYEFLLDAVLSLAALHLSRIYPEDKQVLEASQRYFQSALQGQSHALSNINSQSLSEALFLASTLTAVHAFILTGSEDEPPGSAIFRWLRIGSGGRILAATSVKEFLPNSERLAGLDASHPQLKHDDVVFAPANRDELQPLLDWGTDFESISKLDREAYEKTLSYVGLIYKVAREDGDPPLGLCRRVLAMPSRCPPRFIELADERRPRALAILAHLFASLKLLKVDVWWAEGLAERQVANIRDLLPRGWQEMIKLPLSLISDQKGT